jgi:hypothetical protein
MLHVGATGIEEEEEEEEGFPSLRIDFPRNCTDILDRVKIL